MVRAILEGRKTQTRRLLRKQPHKDREIWGEPEVSSTGWIQEHLIADSFDAYDVPYAVGDRLWVRESLGRRPAEFLGIKAKNGVESAYYLADDEEALEERGFNICPWWKRDKLPAIHMPRSASRLTLIVTDVRVQRLREISEEDAEAEGVYTYKDGDLGPLDISARALFSDLWQSLNAKRAPWDSNPWIAALTFTIARGNIDAL